MADSGQRRLESAAERCRSARCRCVQDRWRRPAWQHFPAERGGAKPVKPRSEHGVNDAVMRCPLIVLGAGGRVSVSTITIRPR